MFRYYASIVCFTSHRSDFFPQNYLPEDSTMRSMHAVILTSVLFNFKAVIALISARKTETGSMLWRSVRQIFSHA